MRAYRPRRASKRWLEGAPDWVFDVIRENDKGQPPAYFILCRGDGDTRADYWFDFMSIAEYGRETGQIRAHDAAGYRLRLGHRRTAWAALPEWARRGALARWAEWERIIARETALAGGANVP